MQIWDVIYNLLPDLGGLIESFLRGFLPDWVVYVAMAVLGGVGVLAFLVGCLLAFMYLERKVIGHFQVRHGPNRVGPHGVLQPIADAIKIMTKEDIIPARADRRVFQIAPAVGFMVPLLPLAVLPFAPGAVLVDLNVGLLYVIAVSSLGAIAMFMAGWASNNKYALLSSMRAVAAMVSYEVPVVLSVLGVVLITGSLSTVSITEAQGWFFDGKVPFLVLQPIGFLVFLLGTLAEINRSPMDLIEAESEIVAGFHTDYSGFKFAMFYLGEYTHALVASALVTILFLGGYKGPLLPPYVWFAGKIFLVFFFMLWLRATLPRLRIDHLMHFAWKVLLPLALANIFLTAVGVLVWNAIFR